MKWDKVNIKAIAENVRVKILIQLESVLFFIKPIKKITKPITNQNNDTKTIRPTIHEKAKNKSLVSSEL